MKLVSKIIHQLVKQLRAEELFVQLGKYSPFFTKFLPLPSEFSMQDVRVVKRDGVIFKLMLSDYMQWHLFADLPDLSWREAVKCLRNDTMVLDIGANCGHFSIKLAGYMNKAGFKNIKIHAFEPNPEVFNNLVNNLDLNPGIKEIVQCHSFGLGNKNEIRKLTYTWNNSGAGSVSKKGEEGLEVKIKRLDEVIGEIEPSSVTFIKLDVEGFEPEVFNGAWIVIEKYKPSIFFEMTPEWYKKNGADPEEIIQRLESLGYHLFGEKENRLLPFTWSGFATHHQYNIFATTHE
ncbi:MAG: FkbM family methyltransferase [Bacteroidetes bacterium]|nr:FkbM family methyltransferase [Bacteroidota bacterium]